MRDPVTAVGGSRRFVDLVHLHLKDRPVLFAEQEVELLKAGVTEFGLSLDEAKGILYNASQVHGVALESQVDRYMTPFMQKNIKKGKLSRRDFNRIVGLYQKLTAHAVARKEARVRVKGIVNRRGLKAKRDWLRLGTRRWFNRIETV